jgi:ribonuclease BN (tRNA processing enzyme)
MTFELVVLGASGTYPAPGAACSGYLLRADGTEVWIDAGSGTFANLQRVTSFRGLRALVLTHLHVDHVVDLYSFYHWVRFSRTNPGLTRVPVHAPAGAGRVLAQILPPKGEGTFGEYLVFHSVGDGDRLTIGPFSLSFVRTRHPVETYAVRAEAEGRVLVYTADTGPSDEVTAHARGADLLVAEATLQAPPDWKDGNPDGKKDVGMQDVHMTAAEAGEMAEAAGAGRLLLTHIPPGLDPERSVEQARERYGGEVSVASDGRVLRV